MPKVTANRPVHLTGRTVEVVLIDGVVITFWTDHAVREVRIVFIEFP